MRLPQLLPPRDLLQQVQGIEGGLRHGRRARLAGVLVAAVQVTILLGNSSWLDALRNGDWAAVEDSWQLVLCLFALVLSLLVVSWGRFWLRESRQPFRYTYSIARFVPVTGDGEQPLLVPLHADLRERLSTRIRRLSLLEPDAEAEVDVQREGVEEARRESHVHVSGQYAIRRRPPDTRWFVEVTSWVAVGGSSRAARLAVPVKYALPPATAGQGADPPPLDSDQYEAILERTYFSIATEIYRQIKEDVASKIDLLPNRWFRASALFHEAEDYASSNTLDAYDEARDLYAAALSIYDPSSAPLPASPIRRPFARAGLRIAAFVAWARARMSWIVPRIGRPEVLAARSQVGYAITLLDSRVLATLAGLRGRAVFEAHPVARRAVRRLERLSPDVPGYSASLFDANVALASAHAGMNDRERGINALQTAGAASPMRADEDPRYVFARAELEPRPLAKIPLYQRTAELAPRFEAAQFELAITSEMLWRTRPTLERNVAETVLKQYGEVLRLNPGNTAAWANSGYVRWLLGEPDDIAQARRLFEGGRRFKEIKREAYVAEIDHGLTRIAAEEGRFRDAYNDYIQTVSARVSLGWALGSYDEYHFEPISDAMLDRFRRYRDEVKRCHADPKDEEVRRTTTRTRDSVLAFAHYDFANACASFYQQTRDYTVLEEGYRACLEATTLNERFMLANYLLYTLELQRAEFVPNGQAPGGLLDRVEELEPGWPEAALLLLARHNQEAAGARDEAERHDTEAAGLERQADEIEQELRPRTWGNTSDDPIRQERARQLREDARKLRAEAEGFRTNATERAAKAAALPRTLLPHAWLWCGDGAEFNWKVVATRQAERELLWERSLTDFHVNVLVGWCTVLAGENDADERLDRLLDLLEQRFRPNDMRLLDLRLDRARGIDDDAEAPPPRRLRRARSQPQPSASDYRRRMEQNVEDWLAGVESPFGALTWLDPQSDAAARQFVKIATSQDFSPYLQFWVGQQLLSRWRVRRDEDARNCALLAFERAMEIEQPDAILQLADALTELERPDASEKLYSHASHSFREPRLLTALAERYETRPDRLADALELYQAARKIDLARPAPFRPAEYYRAAAGRLLFALGDKDGACSELSAMPVDGGELGPEWRVELVRNVFAYGTLNGQGATLRDWLAAAQSAALRAGDEVAARDAGSAILELASEDRTRMLWRPLDSQEFDTRTPVAVPIAVEAHTDFFPQMGETPAVLRMIEQDIPAIREAIKDETGVFVPGFRIRANEDVAPRGYRVLIGDVVMEAAVVPEGTVDDYAFMLARTDAWVRRRLPLVLDMQSVDEMLATWIAESPDDRGPQVDRAIAGTPGRRAFVHLLKQLVADRVPIDDLTPAIEVCSVNDLLDAGQETLVQEVREETRERLDGRDDRHVEVPPGLEEAIGLAIPEDGEDASGAVVISVDELARFRSELSALHAEEAGRPLVVSSAWLRPIVQQLVSIDAPDVPVLSRDELAPNGHVLPALVSRWRQ